jgi:hypothetical protein
MKKAPWRDVSPTEVHWITDNVEAFDSNAPWQGSRVSHVLPPGFEAHVKVLDYAWEDTVIPDYRGSTNRWRMQALAYDTVLPGVAPGRENERPFPYDSARILRTRWREVAGKFGLQVTPEFSPASFNGRTEDGGAWPARIIAPKEGTLCEPALLALLEFLRKPGELFFHWDAHKMLRGGHTGGSCILTGAAGTLPQNWPARVDLMPTHIWPRDRSWIVAMDHELSFALLACAQPMADKLSALDTLETIPVSRQTRIDIEADKANA